jgi:hypothetical protein
MSQVSGSETRPASEVRCGETPRPEEERPLRSLRVDITEERPVATALVPSRGTE